jgi:hypothetical protein
MSDEIVPLPARGLRRLFHPGTTGLANEGDARRSDFAYGEALG